WSIAARRLHPSPAPMWSGRVKGKSALPFRDGSLRRDGGGRTVVAGPWCWRLRPWRPSLLGLLLEQAGPGLVGLKAVQAQEVLAENLAFGLLGELRVAVPLDQILGQLKVPERLQRPAGMEDRRLAAVD